jgi:NAD(P)-dependent dehydrogenase (short-subunit alcohol dehydrogenase family)
LITGASSGIGKEVALALAANGWSITLSARPSRKLDEVVAAATTIAIATEQGGLIDAMGMDLSDLAQVQHRAIQARDNHRRLDLLVCCAGVMSPPKRLNGSGGAELQFTVNHLAHHVLTALLLPKLRSGPDGRIVSVSSVAHKSQADRQPWNPTKYKPHTSYAASKLWQLAWALWLDNRLTTDPSGVRSVAAHPGWVRTALFSTGPSLAGGSLAGRILATLSTVACQSAGRGAQPILAAALDPLPHGHCYLGPSGLMELWGRRAAPAAIAEIALDERFQAAVIGKTQAITRVKLLD